MSLEPVVQLPVAAAAPSSKALGKRRLDDDEPSSSAGAAPEQQATLAQAVQKRERRVTRSSRGQQATADPNSPGNSTDGEGMSPLSLLGTSANLLPLSRTCPTEVLARPDEDTPSLETAPKSRALSDYRTILFLGCSRRDFDF